MTEGRHGLRARLRRATKDTVTPDNLVAYTDQALLLALRGAGQDAVMQVLWIYEHPVDLEGLRRFHGNLGHGLFGRRIERSPLPFGRPRWVSAPGPQAPMAVAEHPRPRAELYDWADEQVELPLDPEWGPTWRLAVQPFTDGSTAVSLVISHCVADGGGVVLTILGALNGGAPDLDYLPPRSRPRLRAGLSDLRQTATDAPEIARTLGKAAKVALRRRHELTAPGVPPVPAASDGDRHVFVPSASASIDVQDWDAMAESLGGNSFSLVAGFAGKVAEHLGRTRTEDGVVTLMIPVNQREGMDDTGGNVVSIANVSFDPTTVGKDLSAARAAIREGIATARQVPDEMVELLPLIPFVPKRAFGRMVDMTFGFSADLPASCSNMGEVPAEALRIDGTAAERVIFRGVDRHLTRDVLERRRGSLTVASVRVAGRIIVVVIGYQPGIENSHAHLREVVAQTLAEFDLTGVIE